MTPDLFRCSPLNTVLSRGACASRYEKRIGPTCSACGVGRQHARGALPSEWSDGSALVTASITPATMASLKIHLAIIESHATQPRRGWQHGGRTIREIADETNIHPQVYRQRLLRGESPETALSPKLRGQGPHGTREVRVGREVLSMRGFARKVGKHVEQVRRWLAQGQDAETIMERCL